MLQPNTNTNLCKMSIMQSTIVRDDKKTQSTSRKVTVASNATEVECFKQGLAAVLGEQSCESSQVDLERLRDLLVLTKKIRKEKINASVATSMIEAEFGDIYTLDIPTILTLMLLLKRLRIFMRGINSLNDFFKSDDNSDEKECWRHELTGFFGWLIDFLKSGKKNPTNIMVIFYNNPSNMKSSFSKIFKEQTLKKISNSESIEDVPEVFTANWLNADGDRIINMIHDEVWEKSRKLFNKLFIGVTKKFACTDKLGSLFASVTVLRMTLKCSSSSGNLGYDLVASPDAEIYLRSRETSEKSGLAEQVDEIDVESSSSSSSSMPKHDAEAAGYDTEGSNEPVITVKPQKPESSTSKKSSRQYHKHSGKQRSTKQVKTDERMSEMMVNVVEEAETSENPKTQQLVTKLQSEVARLREELKKALTENDKLKLQVEGLEDDNNYLVVAHQMEEQKRDSIIEEIVQQLSDLRLTSSLN